MDGRGLDLHIDFILARLINLALSGIAFFDPFLLGQYLPLILSRCLPSSLHLFGLLLLLLLLLCLYSCDGIIILLHEDIGLFLEEGAIVGVVLELVQFSGQHILHPDLLLESVLVVGPLFALHQQEVDNARPLPAGPASSLDGPDGRVPSIVAYDAVDLTDVQTLLAD